MQFNSKMMPKSRKGTEMINIILWFVIGLFVLFVLLAMVTGKIRLFGQGTEQVGNETSARLCEKQGGVCQTVAACPEGKNMTVPAAGWIDCTVPSKCCKA